MSEKIYRVQMNSKGMPNFATAEEVADRPQGEWVNDNKYDMPRCSECGYIPEYNDFIDDYYYSDFCPNCGARMEGEA